MKVTIRTEYKTRQGAGRITAKGGGKQRTIPYDHSRSPGQNHGEAAGILGNALGFNSDADLSAVDNGNGTATYVLTST